MVMACIASVSPMPVPRRSASREREVALPRTTPPWSTYRKRISSSPSASARSTIPAVCSRPFFFAIGHALSPVPLATVEHALPVHGCSVADVTPPGERGHAFARLVRDALLERAQADALQQRIAEVAGLRIVESSNQRSEQKVRQALTPYPRRNRRLPLHFRIARAHTETGWRRWA